MIHFKGFDSFIESSEQDFVIYLNIFAFYNINTTFDGHNSKDLRDYVKRFLIEENLLVFNIEELYNWLNEYIAYLKERDKEEDIDEFKTRYPSIKKTPYPVKESGEEEEVMNPPIKTQRLPPPPIPSIPELQSIPLSQSSSRHSQPSVPSSQLSSRNFQALPQSSLQRSFQPPSQPPPQVSTPQPSTSRALNHFSHLPNTQSFSEPHYHVPPHVVAQQQHIKTSKINIIKDLAICGLTNFGSSCYINSSIQLLFGIKAFKSIFYNFQTHIKNEEFIHILKHPNSHSKHGVLLSEAIAGLLNTFENNGGRSISPSKFIRVCSLLKEDFHIPYEQQDAQEFLLFILDRLDEEMNHTVNVENFISKWKINVNIKEIDQYKKWIEKLYSSGSSPMRDLFEGHIKNTLQCQRCFYESTNFNQFNILSLPTQRHSNLSDVIGQFIKDEILDSWSCPKCNGEIPTIDTSGVFETKKSLFKKKKKTKHHIQSTSIKSTQFIKLPNVLLIHITKLDLEIHIDYPLQLSFNNNGHQIVYQLRGLINHFGTLKSGHYTALINKSPDGRFWCLFDDENVRQNIPVGLNSKDMFILGYERIA